MIAEWRGLPQAVPPPDRLKPVADPLAAVMKKLGLGERMREEQIVKAWREVVGDFIAAHSCPTRMKDGVLHVQVVQPTLHYELDRVLKPQILQKLRQRFGARVIRDVRFRVG